MPAASSSTADPRSRARRAAAPLPAPLPAALRAALDGALADAPRLLLAVSGGLDSICLLHAVAAWRQPGQRVVVATFDHGTGAPARRAVRLVRREARRLGLAVVSGRARGLPAREAAWRTARWRFLRRAARSQRACVVTAHTRDDQVETVALRLLRGAGPRGLAGLAARPGTGRAVVRRPWLAVGRAELEAFAAAWRLAVAEDPSNRSPRHARNRLRHELLPALRRQQPGLDAELLALGERAATWRAEVERVVDHLGVRREPDGSLSVARGELGGYSPDELAVLWPAIAARAGVRLDRRGTRRLATFTNSAGRVARVPLSGDAEVLVLPDRFVVHRRAARPFAAVPLLGAVRVAGWHLRPASAGPQAEQDSLWTAALPADRALTVRSWQGGDRIQRAGPGTARRVKRYLADAGIPGPLRTGWPVVLAEGEIVWVPGVCRSAAASARPGRPVITFVCDRNRC